MAFPWRRLVSVHVECPGVVAALDRLRTQLMADFTAFRGDMNQLKTTMADVLADIAHLLDDTNDQAAIEEARTEIQGLTAQLRAAVQDVAPPPPTP